MTLLVTGATGHVGREIVAQASARGERVVAVSRSEQPLRTVPVICWAVTWPACEHEHAVPALADIHEISACIYVAAVSSEAYARPVDCSDSIVVGIVIKFGSCFNDRAAR